MNLPNIKIVDIKSLISHETANQLRTRKIKQQLVRASMQRDPIIVGIKKKTKVILDGANRFSAINELKASHVLVQLIKYESKDLKLLRWNHLVQNVPVKILLSRLKSLSNIKLISTNPAQATKLLKTGKSILTLNFINKQVYSVINNYHQPIAEQIRMAVDNYNSHKIVRVANNNFSELKKLYPQATMHVIFPQFTKNNIWLFAQNKHLLPAGVTRFILPSRAKQVNAPLSKLTSIDTLYSKNKWLSSYIQKLINQESVRRYDEPTIYYND
ncbi:hypothetical protein ACFL04_04755 [Patescibacteria group bacterium]